MIIIKTCENCQAQPKCAIAPRITDLISLSDFFCSKWTCKATLIDPGQRLADYLIDEPILTAPFKKLTFWGSKIPGKLTDTKVDVIFILNDHVALIYLPTLKAHCFINVRGIDPILRK